MAHLNYLGVLLFVGLCAIFVSVGFKVNILQRWRAFLLTDICLLSLYLTWDIWAAKRRSWFFDSHQIIGVKLLGVLPIEELLFFILVPLMVVITYLSLLKLTKWDRR